MEYQLILEKLKQERIKQGLSLRKLGEHLHLSGQQIYHIEKEKSALKLKDFLEICNLLKIPPQDFFVPSCLDREREIMCEKLYHLPDEQFQLLAMLIFYFSNQNKSNP